MAKHDDEFEGRDTVTLTLDDDSELECIVLNIFKGGDREYIALLPTEGIEAEPLEIPFFSQKGTVLVPMVVALSGQQPLRPLRTSLLTQAPGVPIAEPHLKGPAGHLEIHRVHPVIGHVLHLHQQDLIGVPGPGLGVVDQIQLGLHPPGRRPKGQKLRSVLVHVPVRMASEGRDVVLLHLVFLTQQILQDHVLFPSVCPPVLLHPVKIDGRRHVSVQHLLGKGKPGTVIMP